MSREVMEEFFRDYESEPCLWQVNDKAYHKREKKEAAYARLADILKRIEPGANENTVKKKINNIRSAYRKEIKKVRASLKSGSGTDDIYKPKLWYFELLRFLEDPDSARGSHSDIDSDEDDGDTNSIEVLCTPESVHQRHSTNPQKKRKKEDDKQNESLLSAKEHFKKPTTEFEVMAMNWAFKLERMSQDQRRFAEKFINDILFEGEFGNLNRNSVTINIASNSTTKNLSRPSNWKGCPKTRGGSPKSSSTTSNLKENSEISTEIL